MGDREDFLDWFQTTWQAAERALHDGDAGPRFATWSEHPPVTLFGAWIDANGPDGVRDVFRGLARRFSHPTAGRVELIAAEVSDRAASIAAALPFRRINAVWPRDAQRAAGVR